MPLDPNINTREFAKFALTTGGLTAVRVLFGDSVSFQFSGLNIGGLVTEVVVNDTTWTALPATPLANRNAMRIQNFTGVEVRLNYSAAVVGYVGAILQGAEGQTQYDITDNIILYAKSAPGSGSVTLIVEEIS